MDTNQRVQPQPTGVDGKSLAIGILSVTATILMVGLLILATVARPAYGIGMLDRGSQYIMLTQQVSNSGEAVVIIDAEAERMGVYALNPSTKKIVLLQSNIPLDQMPGANLRR